MIGEFIQSGLKDVFGDDARGKQNRGIITSPFRMASTDHTIRSWATISNTVGSGLDMAGGPG